MKFVAKYWCVLSLAWLLTARVVLAAKKSVIAQIAVGGKITIGGEEFIKSNNKGLILIIIKRPAPFGAGLFESLSTICIRRSEEYRSPCWTG